MWYIHCLVRLRRCRRGPVDFVITRILSVPSSAGSRLPCCRPIHSLPVCPVVGRGTACPVSIGSRRHRRRPGHCLPRRRSDSVCTSPAHRRSDPVGTVVGRGTACPVDRIPSTHRLLIVDRIPSAGAPPAPSIGSRLHRRRPVCRLPGHRLGHRLPIVDWIPTLIHRVSCGYYGESERDG